MQSQAMAYRDARENTMTNADWSAIAEQLTESYCLLKRAVSARAQ
jgi:hypothetical protein